MKKEELLPLNDYPLTLIQICNPLENKLLGNGTRMVVHGQLVEPGVC